MQQRSNARDEGTEALLIQHENAPWNVRVGATAYRRGSRCYKSMSIHNEIYVFAPAATLVVVGHAVFA
jgi:hypothetical protein